MTSLTKYSRGRWTAIPASSEERIAGELSLL